MGKHLLDIPLSVTVSDSAEMAIREAAIRDYGIENAMTAELRDVTVRLLLACVNSNFEYENLPISVQAKENLPACESE